MNILLVWREIPTYWNSSTSRIFHLLKYSKEYNNKITLITFKSKNVHENEVEKYGDIITIDYPSKMCTILNTFMDNICLRNIHIPVTAYSLKMKKEIEKIMKTGNFDLIYVDQVMLFHVLGLDFNMPRILDIVDPVVYSSYQIFLHEKTIPEKIKWLLRYYNYKFFEVPRYKDFNTYVCVTPIHKNILEPYISQSKNIFCIPQGVDIESFKPMSLDEEPQSLIFTGLMSYRPNVHAILFFCKKIYPLIKQQIANIKLYVIGSSPSKEILRLRSRDVVITGFVEDIRPYITKASVVIVPIVTDDGGFKIKILDAMAMGKAIVSTSLGAKGLDVTNGENIIIADNPKEFAYKVIELLTDEHLRDKIGANARKFVEQNYSWEQMTNVLNDAFKKVIEIRR